VKRNCALWISVGASVIALLGCALVLFLRDRSRSALEDCVRNLSFLEGAKEQWALEHKATTNASVTWEQLYDYVKYPGWPPPCPRGGVYTLGRIGELPSCSIPKHTTYFRDHR